MTTIEKNKDLVRRFVAALNRHDSEAALALAATDLVNHAAIPEAQGADGMKKLLAKLFKAMPDLTTTCEDVIAEDDRVVCRVRVRGTQTGPLEMTRLPLPASGREMSIEQIHVFRIKDDKVSSTGPGATTSACSASSVTCPGRQHRDPPRIQGVSACSPARDARCHELDAIAVAASVPAVTSVSVRSAILQPPAGGPPMRRAPPRRPQGAPSMGQYGSAGRTQRAPNLPYWNVAPSPLALLVLPY